MKNLTLKPPPLVAAILFLFMADAVCETIPPSKSYLEIDVLGVRHAHGSIRIALYSDSERLLFPNQFPFLKQQKPLVGGIATFTFEYLPYGVYAGVAFHDENGNGSLDHNLLGIPTERWGVTGKRPSFGQPEFNAALFQVNDRRQKLVINIE